MHMYILLLLIICSILLSKENLHRRNIEVPMKDGGFRWRVSLRPIQWIMPSPYVPTSFPAAYNYGPTTNSVRLSSWDITYITLVSYKWAYFMGFVFAPLEPRNWRKMKTPAPRRRSLKRLPWDGCEKTSWERPWFRTPLVDGKACYLFGFADPSAMVWSFLLFSRYDMILWPTSSRSYVIPYTLWKFVA